MAEPNTAVAEPEAPIQPDPSAGAPDTSWQAAIPPDYAKDKLWESYKNQPLSAVLKSHAETMKLRGRSIPLPPDGAKPDDVAKWKTDNAAKLGGLIPSAPATPADYKFDRPKVAEQLGWNDEAEQMMRGVWHKNGFTNDQVVALVQAYNEFGGKMLQSATEHGTKTKTELEAEWGAEYGPRIGNVFRLIDQTGEKYGISDLFESTGLIMHANVVRWLDDIAQSRGEHTVADITTTGTTLSDFDRRHQELLAEMEKANPGSPRATQLQASLEALLKQRYPE